MTFEDKNQIQPHDEGGEVEMSPETAPKFSHGIAANFPFVQGKCPACGLRSLFVGSGGYITCSSLDCTDPCSPSKALGITFPEEPNHVH